jgi:hypothetical protein
MAKDTEVFPKPNTKFEAVMFESPNLNILLYILDQKPKYKPGHLEKVWVEIMGGGMPKKSVLKKMGLEGYNGWAFGFGLERLAIISMELPDIRLLWSEDPRVKKQLKMGQKFVEVSKYPPIVRDISFIVDKSLIPKTTNHRCKKMNALERRQKRIISRSCNRSIYFIETFLTRSPAGFPVGHVYF